MQTRKLASSGPPKSYSLTYKGSGRPRLSKATRGGRGVGGGSPGSASEGLDPGKLAARAGSARPPARQPGAGWSRLPRRTGAGKGAEARGQHSAPGRLGRLGARGRLGCDGAGRVSGAETPAPPSAGPATPTPRAKMATWTAGEPGARGLGRRGGGGGGEDGTEGERRQKKKKKKRASPRERGGPGLLFLLVLAAGALHGESVPRGAFPAGGPRASLRPKRWLGPHAQRKGQVQRRGARRDAPSNPPQPRDGEAAGAAGCARWGLRLGLLGRSVLGLACQGLARHCRRRRRGRSSRPLRRGGFCALRR